MIWRSAFLHLFTIHVFVNARNFKLFDDETFQAYTSRWQSTHESWIDNDINIVSTCPGRIVYPICVQNRHLQNLSDACPIITCHTDVENVCDATPSDTIDYIPPPLNICGIVDAPEDVLAPYYGLAEGIPPLFTPQSPQNLIIHGKLQATYENNCHALGKGTIEIWHASVLLAQNSTQLPPGRLREVSCRQSVDVAADGSFTLQTTMPPSYGPPRHVNIHVTSPGYATLTTRLYFDLDLRLRQLVEDEEAVEGVEAKDPSEFDKDLLYVSENDASKIGTSLRLLYIRQDPRVARLRFNTSSSGNLVNGYFETEVTLTLTGLRSNADAPNALSPPLNLTGVWYDDEGGVVRVETKGDMFVATEYPHIRKWGSVFGVLRGDVITGTEFRVPILTPKYLKLDQDYNIWSTDATTGNVLNTDAFQTNVDEMAIEWTGGYTNRWHKKIAHDGFRFLKLVIHRVAGENAESGLLIINEIEFYEGYLAQRPVPATHRKMISPRNPAPLLASCSSFQHQMYHCFHAFDGNDSSNSSWRTVEVGSSRNALSIPQWVLLDMGAEGPRIIPTAVKIVCGAGNAEDPAGCPMTFTLYGSNSPTTGFKTLAHVDLFDYKNDYALGGKTFTFFSEAPFGRVNGHRCGSCTTPPYFACATTSYDGTCASRYCDVSGICADPPLCPPGEYLDAHFASDRRPMYRCLNCPAGKYGDVAGLVHSECKGDCDAGCYCTGGSPTSCQYECGDNSFYCPKGSTAPIPAGAGEKTIGGSATRRVSSVPCVVGHYCIDGVEEECPAGVFGNSSGLSTSRCTETCPSGTYCPSGSVLPIICPLGHYCPDGKMKLKCPAGRYGDREGLRDRSCSGECPVGYYCPQGSVSATTNKCPAGRYGEVMGLSDDSCSGICEEGYYCPAASSSSRQIPCGNNRVYCPIGSATPREVSVGFYSAGGNNITRTTQIPCEKGNYCVGGEKYSCPPGTYGATEKLFNDVKPDLSIYDATCSGLCSEGFYCPAQSTSAKEVPCPAGRYGDQKGLRDSNCSAICPLGHYCPAGTITPIKCPPGVFGGYLGLTDSSCSRHCDEGVCSAVEELDSICREGYYCEDGAVSPTEHECGHNGVYCPAGSKAPLVVKEGHYSVGASSRHRSSQKICELGHYCVHGVAVKCPAGVYGAKEGLSSPECTAPCPAGYYCPEGSKNGTTNRCPAGRYGSVEGLYNRACTGVCTAGYYCPEGSTSSTQLPCGSVNVTHPNSVYCPRGSMQPLVVPAGYYSLLGRSHTREAIEECPEGSYCIDGMLRDCPPGRYGDRLGLSSPLCSGPCRRGFYCPVGSVISAQIPCPRGRFGESEGMGSPECTGPCQNPRFCPPGSTQDRPPTTDHSFL